MAARRRAAKLEYRGGKRGMWGDRMKKSIIFYMLRRSHISKPMSRRSIRVVVLILSQYIPMKVST